MNSLDLIKRQNAPRGAIGNSTAAVVTDPCVAAHASAIIGLPLCGSRLSSRRREWRVRALSSKQNLPQKTHSKNADLAMMSQNLQWEP